MKKSHLLYIPVVVLLAACKVGPDYERPEVPAMQAYPEVTASSAQPVQAEWWKQFNDNELNDLVTKALKANADLQVAAAKVEQATASYADVSGAALPQINAGGGVTQTRVSNDGYSPITSYAGRNRTDFTANLSTTFELDFWGKIRRASEASRAQLLASSEARLQVELAMVSSVVRTYALVGALDLQVENATQLLAIRAEESRIIGERIKAGVGSPSEKVQAEVLHSAAVSALSDLRRARANAEHLLGALISQPDLVVAPKSKALPMKVAAPAVGLPSDLLHRRPDVLAAEQTLISANALIGYNKAFFFPSFSLTGSGGVESRQLNSLFSVGNDTGLVGLGFSVPLLDWGRTQAHVDAAVGVRNEAAANYNRTILNAFREVRDALTGLNELGVSATAAKQRLTSAQEGLRIEKARLARGEVTPLTELAARRTVAESQIALTQVLLQQLSAEVDLVQALGGARPDVTPADANAKKL